MKDPSQILSEVAETQEQKDSDYGEAWRLVGETLSLWADEDLTIDTDPETLSSLGLFTRRLDKLLRAFNGEFGADDLNYESLQDSHQDEAGYAAMHAALLAEQEPVTYERIQMVGVATGQPEPLETVSTTIKVGDVATEDDYDEALPIHPPYQEKYEELVGD